VRWAALPFAAAYLGLLAVQLRSIVTTTNLDADTVSAPVIGQLFPGSGAHAKVVLGTFGWYQSLLFELATRWLAFHRGLWVLAPYALALAAAALVAWSVWQVAGAWAAGLSAAVLVCAAPPTLHLQFSMTQHSPDWFCCALLGAFLVMLERRAAVLRPMVLISMTLVVGVIVGVNAASDVLTTIAGIAPFMVAVLACYVLTRGANSVRAVQAAIGVLAVVAVTWLLTDAAMSALNVAPEQGLDNTRLAAGAQFGINFRLWWQSIAVLGNGDFFGREVSLSSVLAVACAVVSLTAVVLLPRAGWRELRRGWATSGLGGEAQPERMALIVFWSASAILLSGAFLVSSLPVDIHSDRYLVGLVFAGAATIPVLAAGRPLSESAALLGTCLFALGGVVSMAHGANTQNTERFPSPRVAERIAAIAAGRHLADGYAGYWDAAPISWASSMRIRVYPVSVCDQGAHLCRFDLHYISSWYGPRPGDGSFLLTDSAHPLVAAPTPDLGRPVAVYHIGTIRMYVYPYDIARRIVQ
jgi:hypothetical protein